MIQRLRIFLPLWEETRPKNYLEQAMDFSALIWCNSFQHVYVEHLLLTMLCQAKWNIWQSSHSQRTYREGFLNGSLTLNCSRYVNWGLFYVLRWSTKYLGLSTKNTQYGQGCNFIFFSSNYIVSSSKIRILQCHVILFYPTAIPTVHVHAHTHS